LLESLDPQVDDDVEGAWQAEIQKRLHEVETGTVSLVPWSEVRKMLDLDEKPFRVAVSQGSIPGSSRSLPVVR
jgi:hypothetical protein